jgi:ribosome biogenesis GTPase
VVGDGVQFMPTDPDRGLITQLLPRQNLISRRAVGANPLEGQGIAANIDLVLPVFAAANPAPRWNLLDRYLVTAEAFQIPALICISKADLITGLPDAEQEAFTQMVGLYREIGYPVMLVSSTTQEGLPELQTQLTGKKTVLLGKSGVGKTSLLNALQPGLGRQVQQISRATGKGMHTTTSAEMFPLNSGGAIIDTPGIREFGLYDIDRQDLALYFPEIRPHLGHCKFGMDCQHDEEPGCAVRKAVMNGLISPLRYRSYQKMKEDLP